MEKIFNYEDFLKAVNKAGFSMGGGNSEGIYSVIPWNWNEDAPYETPVVWHTGEIETDPWEWRMRVLDEGKDIAYAKCFVKKSGYITREWYPYFLAVRRGNKRLMDEYMEGKISNYAKRVYEIVEENGILPRDAIKSIGGFKKEDKSKFDSAITELQMKLYLTMCGHQQKLSKKGEEYGWSSTVFCKVEDFWGYEIMDECAKIDPDDAFDKIREQILKINPNAEEKKIKRFILA